MSDIWMPQDEWDKQRKGDNIFAAYVKKPFQEILASDLGYWITDLERTRVFLARNQYVKGYCIVVAKEAGITEPFQMYEHQRRLFFEDTMRVASGIQKALSPFNINYLMMGNHIPHLHMQIVPRYRDDGLPLQGVDPDTQILHLSESDYQSRVADIREGMGFSRDIITDDNLLKFMDEQARIRDWPPLKLEDSQNAVR